MNTATRISALYYLLLGLAATGGPEALAKACLTPDERAEKLRVSIDQQIGYGKIGGSASFIYDINSLGNVENFRGLDGNPKLLERAETSYLAGFYRLCVDGQTKNIRSTVSLQTPQRTEAEAAKKSTAPGTSEQRAAVVTAGEKPSDLAQTLELFRRYSQLSNRKRLPVFIWVGPEAKKINQVNFAYMKNGEPTVGLIDYRAAKNMKPRGSGGKYFSREQMNDLRAGSAGFEFFYPEGGSWRVDVNPIYFGDLVHASMFNGNDASGSYERARDSLRKRLKKAEEEVTAVWASAPKVNDSSMDDMTKNLRNRVPLISGGKEYSAEHLVDLYNRQVMSNIAYGRLNYVPVIYFSVDSSESYQVTLSARKGIFDYSLLAEDHRRKNATPLHTLYANRNHNRTPSSELLESSGVKYFNGILMYPRTAELLPFGDNGRRLKMLQALSEAIMSNEVYFFDEFTGSCNPVASVERDFTDDYQLHSVTWPNAVGSQGGTLYMNDYASLRVDNGTFSYFLPSPSEPNFPNMQSKNQCLAFNPYVRGHYYEDRVAELQVTGRVDSGPLQNGSRWTTTRISEPCYKAKVELNEVTQIYGTGSQNTNYSCEFKCLAKRSPTGRPSYFLYTNDVSKLESKFHICK